MARILLRADNVGTRFIVSRVLVRDGGHEVISHHSDAEVLTSAQNTLFNLVFLEANQGNKLNLELAHALTHYDASLPLTLIAFHIQKEEKEAIAKIPFKAILGMPLTPRGLLEAVRQYART